MNKLEQLNNADDINSQCRVSYSVNGNMDVLVHCMVICCSIHESFLCSLGVNFEIHRLSVTSCRA